MRISGKTQLVGVTGCPVEHSCSPQMHNAALTEMGLDWCYLASQVETEHLKEAIAGMGALGLRGINVTIPHKHAVIEYLG